MARGLSPPPKIKPPGFGEVATGQAVGVPMRETHEMLFAGFSPDGRLVATGAEEGMARVWNAATGAPVSPPIRYHGSVFQVVFSPDGSRIVTANGDGRADVLDARTAAPLVRGIQESNNIFTAAFSPDGTRLLTASADRAARLWDANTGRALGPVVSARLLGLVGNVQPRCHAGGRRRPGTTPPGCGTRKLRSRSPRRCNTATRCITRCSVRTERWWRLVRVTTPHGSGMRARATP